MVFKRGGAGANRRRGVRPAKEGTHEGCPYEFAMQDARFVR